MHQTLKAVEANLYSEHRRAVPTLNGEGEIDISTLHQGLKYLESNVHSFFILRKKKIK